MKLAVSKQEITEMKICISQHDFNHFNLLHSSVAKYEQNSWRVGNSQKYFHPKCVWCDRKTFIKVKWLLGLEPCFFFWTHKQEQNLEADTYSTACYLKCYVDGQRWTNWFFQSSVRNCNHFCSPLMSKWPPQHYPQTSCFSISK